ncbi:hypothetical protein NUW54_g10591 [Trametes sanguinea]|uniref:Uncharacterized protein n=1 Tax=Trametes sanguinea TaxID=158606 RepID=A0ACC1NXN7_9APHY|nr:hypothetical protein NUW54_g10591 [Trametes sanguinea]
MFSKTAISELADAADPHRPLRRRSGSLATLRRVVTIGLLCLTTCAIFSGSVLYRYLLANYDIGSGSLPFDAQSILSRCESLQLLPGPPADFYSRSRSDRFQPGTSPVIIRNATIWTGFSNGSEIVHGDIFSHAVV